MDQFRHCKAGFRMVEWGHNHVTNEYIFSALKQSNGLDNESILSMLDAFGQTNTVTKQITSYIADSIDARAARDLSSVGDTLGLDWMHNCTNLGFYVGSLVATIPTGRGVPDLDFLCLNQQKDTLLAVLTWFKEKNPS
ncbi:hypothetical protein PHMEG_0008704 [Phytophthora megakarya]|uniref:Uncharacterized protein n=1 Tax=Phytophthora megakarya TaxID=4795 RepID=A0A225WI38_9STRA|nr:hypothetical protein PHMEG_0008704 [Phytophthora megakarya]